MPPLGLPQPTILSGNLPPVADGAPAEWPRSQTRYLDVANNILVSLRASQFSDLGEEVLKITQIFDNRKENIIDILIVIFIFHFFHFKFN